MQFGSVRAPSSLSIAVLIPSLIAGLVVGLLEIVLANTRFMKIP